VKKLWAKNEIDGKWAKSSFAQRSERSERRKNLSVGERENVTGHDLLLLGGGTVDQDLNKKSQVNTTFPT
jgi:hypothetical protein